MVSCNNHLWTGLFEDKPRQMHSDGSASSVAINLNKRWLCLRNYSKYTAETASSEKT